MYLKVLLILLFISAACNKDEAKVSESKTNGGGTTGNPTTGSDPLASEAWHLENTGQTGFSNSLALNGEDINATYVHLNMNILGRGIRVAVSDSGAQITHPDLAGNALAGFHRDYSLSSPSSWHNASPMPIDGEAHGTAVTGLISALGWNSIGSRGVAPSSKFAAFRFIYETPTNTEESSLAKIIDQYNGDFDIFNYSYGWDGRLFYPSDDILEDAVQAGTKELRNGKGALYVQAAGNSDSDLYVLSVCDTTCTDKVMNVTGNANSHEELASPFRIIVGATNASGEKSSYSTPGSSLWVSAPGGEYGVSKPAMMTTDIQGCTTGMSFTSTSFSTLFNFGGHPLNPNCDYTNIMNGTSSAAPVVSGVMALMLEANPNLSWRDVKHILAMTSEPIDFDVLSQAHPKEYDLQGHVYDYKWVTNSAGVPFSNWYGFGRVDARAAVEEARSYDLSTLGEFEQTKTQTDTWYYDSGVLNDMVIPDASSSGLEHKIWVGHNYVIENVQIKITTDHPFPGEIAIIVQSPGLTESRVLNLNSNIYVEQDERGISLEDFTMSTNAFYKEESEGWWKIKIVDGSNMFGTGNLLRWKILINGHRKSTELSRPYPPTSITLGSIPATSDMTPTFAFTNSVSHPSLIGYEASVTKHSDGTVVQDWTSLGLSNSAHQIIGIFLTRGALYDLKIRAVSADGTSSVQLKQWQAN
jgi:subtilisin family serine protease/subtilisin-like proprotein convertase family protein